MLFTTTQRYGPRIISSKLALTDLDMFEFKHVSLNKRASDLLIGPSDEQLVIVISL